MSYDMFGYSLLNPMGYNPYNMGLSSMTNSLYMTNLYNQLKNYAAKGTDALGNTGSLDVSNLTSTDFQTAFNEAFRKALQESLGISKTSSETSAGTGNSTSKTAANRTVSAQTAYNNYMSSYGSHPSRIWTSKLV